MNLAYDHRAILARIATRYAESVSIDPHLKAAAQALAELSARDQGKPVDLTPKGSAT